MKHKNFTLGGFCPGRFCLGGFCPGDFCEGICPGGFCLRTPSSILEKDIFHCGLDTQYAFITRERPYPLRIQS